MLGEVATERHPFTGEPMLRHIELGDVRLVAIDPESGGVVGRLDLSDLLRDGRPADPEGVLNGIAHDPSTGHLFVTGKLWSCIFEIRLLDPS